MLRNSSTHALASRTSQGLLGSVRAVPISTPVTTAITQALAATESVQPQAVSIQSR